MFHLHQNLQQKCSGFLQTKQIFSFALWVLLSNAAFSIFSLSFLLETSWSNWATMNWRSTSLVDMDSKLVTKLSKDGGRLMKSTMYTSSFSIFTSMERNWFARAFTMLMCASKFSPSYILMVKNLLWRNNLFPMVLASCTPQSVSQVLLTFLQYWMCASCASVKCSQNNAMPLSPFRYNSWFNLYHLELLHCHQQTSKAHAWKASCASWTSKGESCHHQTFPWLSKTPFGGMTFGVSRMLKQTLYVFIFKINTSEKISRWQTC